MLFESPRIRALGRLLIFIVTVLALIRGSNWAVGRLLPGADGITGFLVREVLQLLIFLAVSWGMGRLEGRTLADYGLPWRRMFQARFWQGALLGFVGATALMIALRAFGVFDFGHVALHGADIAIWAIAYTLVFILVAVFEEFRGRGYGLFTLTQGIGFWPAALISSAYFAYRHVNNSGEDLIGVFNAGLFGMFTCFLLRRTGDLWMPIGLHASFDWSETYFYGVADSGQKLPGHLLESTSSGPGWLSGGTVGPEGSVLATVLVLAMWLLSALWLREVKYTPAAAPAVAPTSA